MPRDRATPRTPRTFRRPNGAGASLRSRSARESRSWRATMQRGNSLRSPASASIDKARRTSAEYIGRMLHVAREDEGRIEVWTIDRPKAANALDRETLERLAAAVDDAERRVTAKEPVRAIVLCAAPRIDVGDARPVFC